MHVVTERSTITAERQQRTSIPLGVTGWGSGTVPAVSWATPDGRADPWLSLTLGHEPGRLVVSVVFDRSQGPMARAGTYPVDVHVRSGDEAAVAHLEFVVEPHRCLRIRPRPSFTWDPVARTATIGVSVWNCGNVALDVEWAAQVRGRRLVVDGPSATLEVGGHIPNATLTVSIPDGRVDAGTEIEIAAYSGTTTSVERATNANPRPVGSRTVKRVVGATVAVAAIALGVVAAGHRSSDGAAPATTGGPTSGGSLGGSSGGSSDTTGVSDTTVTTGASTTAASTTVATATTAVPPPPPQIVVDGATRQALEVATGSRATATFVIVNRGGSEAAVHVGPAGAPAPFGVTPTSCDGPLAPDQTCEVGITFAPSKPGSSTVRVTVVDDVTAASLELTVVGRATTVDLVAIVGDPAWSDAGCATGIGESFHFSVRNDSRVAAPATTATVTSGGRSVAVPVRALQPGETLALVADVAPSCSPDCTARVTVDPTNAIPELSEDNNTDTWFTVG